MGGARATAAATTEARPVSDEDARRTPGRRPGTGRRDPAQPGAGRRLGGGARLGDRDDERAARLGVPAGRGLAAVALVVGSVVRHRRRLADGQSDSALAPSPHAALSASSSAAPTTTAPASPAQASPAPQEQPPQGPRAWPWSPDAGAADPAGGRSGWTGPVGPAPERSGSRRRATGARRPGRAQPAEEPSRPLGTAGQTALGAATDRPLGEPFPEPADDGEPPIEDVPIRDALRVAQLDDDVQVVDGHPRYHLAGCPTLAGAGPCPDCAVSAARRAGFTPCGTCRAGPRPARPVPRPRAPRPLLATGGPRGPARGAPAGRRNRRAANRLLRSCRRDRSPPGRADDLHARPGQQPADPIGLVSLVQREGQPELLVLPAVRPHRVPRRTRSPAPRRPPRPRARAAPRRARRIGRRPGQRDPVGHLQPARLAGVLDQPDHLAGQPGPAQLAASRSGPARPSRRRRAATAQPDRGVSVTTSSSGASATGAPSTGDRRRAAGRAARRPARPGRPPRPPPPPPWSRPRTAGPAPGSWASPSRRPARRRRRRARPRTAR